MGRFKIRSLSKSPRPRRNTDNEERPRETTEDSWKLVDYPAAMSESGEGQAGKKTSLLFIVFFS